jgi:hypothetical protein
VVVQPVTGHQNDAEGSPLGDPEGELAKLSPEQRTILTSSVRRDVIKQTGSEVSGSDFNAAARDFEVRGLVRRTSRGLTLTGRGLILHEALAVAAGKDIGGFPKSQI